MTDPTPSPDATALVDETRQGRLPAGQDPAKRDQILDGADAVFLRSGFDAASMNDITREAGVSKSTVYVYFSSKEELFEALVARQRERLFVEVWQQLDRPGSPAEVLTRYGTVLARTLCTEPVIRAHRIVVGVTERRPDLGRRFYESGSQRGRQRLKAYLEAEVAKGTLDIADLDLAAYQFVDLCLAGLFRRRLLADLPEPPSDAAIAHVVGAAVRMFLGFYGRDGAAPAG
jgi:AcrR family transcriptional regulator